jgi:predicted ATPase
VIKVLAFDGYRSLCDLRLELDQLTVITGGNGTGKSNVYRALKLLVDAAEGNLGRALAREGGMPSALFAGNDRPTKQSTGGLRLSIGFSDQAYAYELRLGLPNKDRTTMFGLDPHVKEETIRTLIKPRVNLLERRNVSAMLRDEAGHPITFGTTINIYESVLSQLGEPHRYPVLSMLRERLRRWRFYHQFRTDAESPTRAAQVSSFTPVLSHDGSDLAAALQTIFEIGDARALAEGIREAFEGAQIEITAEHARFELALAMPGLRRALTAAELSDGTLRYLALLAALYSPRPPELLVLNEPETSLHPSVLVPLAKQIVAASAHSQIIVVSHAAALVDAIEGNNVKRVELEKRYGKTTVANRKMFEVPAWKWTS